jgi:hypothetical protein
MYPALNTFLLASAVVGSMFLLYIDLIRRKQAITPYVSRKNKAEAALTWGERLVVFNFVVFYLLPTGTKRLHRKMKSALVWEPTASSGFKRESTG